MAKAVDTDVENIGYLNPPNVYKPAILSIDIVGEYNPNDGAFNTYRITQNDGRIYDIRVKNGSGGSTGRGIADIDETPSTESSGINIIRITYTDGTHEDFQVRNGAKGEQGERGIQGPAGIDSVTAEALDDGYSADGPEVVVGPVVDGVLPMTFKHLQGPQGEPAVAIENYVTVEATSGMTIQDVLDLLPEEGSADTLYRVACWDGSQYDDTAYAEYGWYSNAYVLLAVRTPGIDSVPTADSDNLVKSGGVAAGLSQLGQEIGAEIITSYELVVSSSSQSKRIDFAKAQKGRFNIAFDGGATSGFACKVFLYNGSTAAQNLVWESERFGFNKWVDYSGNEFDIAVFTVYGDMVVTAGEANATVELGIFSTLSSLEERIDAGEKNDFALMVKTHGYNLSGSPVLDENGLLVQSGVSWGDGSAGTLRKTNFNEDVLEYAVETVTHTVSSKTVQYSYQFSELGEVTKETINIS